MRLSCTQCGSSIEVPQEWAARAQGVSVPCKQCGADIVVGSLAPPPLPNSRAQVDLPPPLQTAHRSARPSTQASALASAPPPTPPGPRYQTGRATSATPRHVDTPGPLPRPSDETRVHTVAADEPDEVDRLVEPRPTLGTGTPKPPQALESPTVSPALLQRPKLRFASNWRWLAAVVVLGLAVAMIHHVWWRIPAADTYTALDHERHMRADLAADVLAGMKALGQLPAGDPKSIDVAERAVAEFEAKIVQRAQDLEGDVTAAAVLVASAQDELNQLNVLPSLNRIRERRLVGNRWVDDWNGGHFEATYAVGYKTCGADQCGGSCGICGDAEVCYSSYCRCVPKCSGKACGPDGCGGVCGGCAADSLCRDGLCLRKPQTAQAGAVGCTPVCGDAAPAPAKGKKSKGLAALFAGGSSASGGDAATDRLAIIRLQFAALIDRGQALPADQLADWLAALDGEVAALTKVATEIGEARAEQPKLAAELTDVAAKLKAAKDAEKAAKKDLATTQKSAAKDSASVAAGQLENMTQVAKTAAGAVVKLTEQQSQLKANLTVIERRIKDLEKRAKLADALRPQLIIERSNFAKLLARIDEVRKSLASAEARLEQAKKTKDAGVLKLRGELAPQLEPARFRLAGLAKPFVPLAGIPLGDRAGGHSGNYQAAPEALAHLAVGPVETDDALQARLDEFVLRSQALLGLRREAWGKLSQTDQGKFEEWPVLDNALEQHIAHIEALLASNARLARIWSRIGE